MGYLSTCPGAPRPSELTCGREQGGRPRQVVGVVDGSEETGAWRAAQELGFQSKVQFMWVRLHLFLKQQGGNKR